MLYCLLQSLLFKFFSLNSRSLQERGMSSFGILKIQRYAIIPAIVFAMLCMNAHDVHLLFYTTKWYFLAFISVGWVVASFTGFFMLNSTNSLSYLSAITAIINLPMIIISAKIFNGDSPNLMAVVGLFFLVCAILLEPTAHESNKRSKFSYPVYLIIAATVVNAVLCCLEGGLYKNFIPSFKNELFPISMYILAIMSMLNVTCLFIPSKKSEVRLMASHKFTALSIPLFWFIASIPEGLSFASLPLYTIACIASVSFLVNIASDVKNNRIFFDLRTVVFSIMILASIVLSSLSVK